MVERPARDWLDWHRPYDDPESPLSRRLQIVRQRLREALDSRGPGAIRLVSMCAGQGRDVLGVLPSHARRDDVTATLAELDKRNARIAAAAAAAAGLAGVRVLQADAALTDAYAGIVPADIVLACGVFGNISDADIRRTVETLPSLCAPGATVLWTRGRFGDADVAQEIRAWFIAAGFEEVSFDAPDDVHYRVGVNRLVVTPPALERGARMFTFLR